MDALQPQFMDALQPQFMDALQPQFMDALQPQIQTFMAVLGAPHPRFSDQFGKEPLTSFEQTRYP
jgi:hypothetical protein